MAESSHPLGYQCEFIDSVHENFYCKKCSLVARRLVYTTCCGESYCHACIADIQQRDKPCPECGQQNFTTMNLFKHQRQMECLKVCCSMRERGCSWSGVLGKLDAHLDPEQNHCQHVDVKCPLHCQKTIPKNKVEQHVARECVKRDHVCQYCDFKASYEVVVDTHWSQCSFFPLQCPNFCGVTCERDVMEDHMRICHLEELACDFSSVGCGGRFRREDLEEHVRQNNLLHLTMTAAATVRMNQLLQHKLQEQDGKLQEQEKKLQEQEKKLEEQEQKFGGKNQELEKKFHKLLQEQDKKLVELQEKSDQNQVAVKEVTNFSLKQTFAMENFSKEKEKDEVSDWKSAAIYTHVCGYKFCIGIDPNGWGDMHGKAVRVDLCAMQGEYDHQLKWPSQASFTIELLNQHGGENIIHTLTKVKWEKPTTPYAQICSFGHFYGGYGRYCAFIEHCKLKEFLANDTLYFRLSTIAVY